MNNEKLNKLPEDLVSSKMISANPFIFTWVPSELDETSRLKVYFKGIYVGLLSEMPEIEEYKGNGENYPIGYKLYLDESLKQLFIKYKISIYEPIEHRAFFVCVRLIEASLSRPLIYLNQALYRANQSKEFVKSEPEPNLFETEQAAGEVESEWYYKQEREEY